MTGNIPEILWNKPQALRFPRVKKKYFIPVLYLFILIMYPAASPAQDLIFCEQVSKEGVPQHPSTFFYVGKNGGYLQLLVKLSHPVNTTSVVFDIWKKEKDGSKETFDNTIRMEVQPEWSWFKKEVAFQLGNFSVYVYDDRDQPLAAGEITVIYK